MPTPIRSDKGGDDPQPLPRVPQKFPAIGKKSARLRRLLGDRPRVGRPSPFAAARHFIPLRR
jgi:hypothetical protein